VAKNCHFFCGTTAIGERLFRAGAPDLRFSPDNAAGASDYNAILGTGAHLVRDRISGRWNVVDAAGHVLVENLNSSNTAALIARVFDTIAARETARLAAIRERENATLPAGNGETPVASAGVGGVDNSPLPANQPRQQTPAPPVLLTKPNRLNIKHETGDMSADERAAEAQFIDEMNSRTDEENDALYDKIVQERHPKHYAKGGWWLNTDIAREMFAPYSADPSKNSHSTAAAARTYIGNRLTRMIASQQADTVVFTGGGPASGKSSSGLTGKTGTLVFDGTLADYEKTASTIKTVLAGGKKVRVVFVWSPIEKAWQNELRRRQIEGRITSDNSLVDRHFKASESIIKFLEKADTDFKGVEFSIWDNSGEYGQQSLAGIPRNEGEDLPSYNSRLADIPASQRNAAALDFMRGVRYASEDETRQRLENTKREHPDTSGVDNGIGEQLVPQRGGSEGGGSSATGGSSGQVTPPAARPPARSPRGRGGFILAPSAALLDRLSLAFEKLWLDEGGALRRFAAAFDKLTGRDDGAKLWMFYKAFRTSADTIVQTMARQGMIDFAGNPTGSASLESAFAGLPNKKVRKDFETYLHARRTVAIHDLDKTGKRERTERNTGFGRPVDKKGKPLGAWTWKQSYDAAVKWLAEHAGDIEEHEFAQRADIIYSWNAGLLDYVAKASPYLSAMVERIRAVDPGAYVPLWRDGEFGEGGDTAIRGTTGKKVASCTSELLIIQRLFFCVRSSQKFWRFDRRRPVNATKKHLLHRAYAVSFAPPKRDTRRHSHRLTHSHNTVSKNTHGNLLPRSQKDRPLRGTRQQKPARLQMV